MAKKKTTTEAEVRHLRAFVYGECSDTNWEQCKENWMRGDSIRWLQEHSKVEPIFKVK